MVAGLVVSGIGMWRLAPWLLVIWIGLMLILIGLYRVRGDV